MMICLGQIFGFDVRVTHLVLTWLGRCFSGELAGLQQRHEGVV